MATRSTKPNTPRNLILKAGAQMEKVFDRIVNRIRARLDVPTLRTLFGAKQRPSRDGSSELSLQLAAMIETPRYDLTLFKVHFGLLTLKAYTTGEHVPRFEAITYNTKQLRCGRVLDRFPEIIGKLTGMVDRFTTTLASPPHWTGSMSASCPRTPLISCRCPPTSEQPESAAST